MTRHFLTYTDFYDDNESYGTVELFGITAFLCALMFTFFAAFYYVETAGIGIPAYYGNVNILKGKYDSRAN